MFMITCSRIWIVALFSCFPMGAVTVCAKDGLPCVSGSGLHRAGHPEHVHSWAIPSNSCRYDGYYVGGGLPFRGEAPCVFHDGAWGWDYFGVLFPKKIRLNWSHGSRHQEGTGAYRTDGPKVFHH
jgi:hypothetical protein